jgi:hypothetical protein
LRHEVEIRNFVGHGFFYIAARRKSIPVRRA